MKTFHLQVQRFHQHCIFELSWGTGQRLSATLIYPDTLTLHYTEWQHTYIHYYKSAFRGRKGASGSLSVLPIDWHGKLVQAEAKLLSAFHHWLRSAELFEIRATIANSYLVENNSATPNLKPHTTLYLTCHTLELERLPWESWEIGTDFSTSSTIRILRNPVNIHQSPPQKQPLPTKKARILVILGDERGLNFQGDRQAISQLNQLADIELIDWQPGQDIPELKAKISAAIASEKGWDVLLFAGHSDETQITGGELAIAPNASISICEIAPQLQQAKDRGLQFALFNSCRGLSLATSLIDLGLSQVAVMREPIHNAVAQVFLVKFLQALAHHHDVYDCLLSACQFLKVEKNLTYPSAYLIPSLFCHPQAQLYRIPFYGLKEKLGRILNQILPTLPEAIALSLLVLLSLHPPVQDWLLEKRVYTQAVYRQLTKQAPISVKPPVLLVQIDEKSLQKKGIVDPVPMNRDYLASLVDELARRQARVIGIDYILARPHGPSDQRLAKSLQAAVQHNPPVTFVFAAIRDEPGNWVTVPPDMANPNWSLIGQIYFLRWYMSLVPLSNAPSQKLPFSYLLALTHQLHTPSPTNPHTPIEPTLTSQRDFFSQITDHLQSEHQQNYKTFFSSKAQLQPITHFSYRLGQMWLHPIIDFSIPPQQVYQTIPAWQLLEAGTSGSLSPDLHQQIIIISPGGYLESRDNFPVPAAMNYGLQSVSPRKQHLMGGEVHAYMIHHFLNRRFVIPIPDLWFVGLAVVLGKFTVHRWRHSSRKPPQPWIVMISGMTVYGWVSLQGYITAGILLPWVFPTATLAIYLCPYLLTQSPQSCIDSA